MRRIGPVLLVFALCFGIAPAVAEGNGRLFQYSTLGALLAGLNLPGYHFHFLSHDRSRGGHVLDLETASGSIAMARLEDFALRLPAAVPGFADLDLADDKSAEVEKVESHDN